jgi:hypothetical protein
MLEFFKYSTHNSLLILPHFWRPFGGKDCGLCPYNPAVEEVGGLEVFLYEAAQNF